MVYCDLEESGIQVQDAINKAQLIDISGDGTKCLTNSITGEYKTFLNETDKATINNRIDTIITTPVSGVSTQEIIDARGGNTALNGRFINIENIKTNKSYVDNLVNSLASGAPKAVSLVANMTDITKNYVYTGAESGYIAGNWYYWNGTAWTSGGMYQAIAIEDKSISPEKTDFLIESKNKFNKNTAILNKYVDDTTGLLVDTVTQYSSDWIEVLPSTDYTRTAQRKMAFYDSTKTYISGIASGVATPHTFTTPANCCYVRTSLLNEELNTTQLELGTTQTPYEAYIHELNTSKVKIIVDSSNVNDKAIIPSKMNILRGYIGKSYYYTINVDTVEHKVVVLSTCRIFDETGYYTAAAQTVNFPTSDGDYNAYKFVFFDKATSQIVIKTASWNPLGNDNQLLFLFAINAGKIMGGAWQVKINGVNNIDITDIPDGSVSTNKVVNLAITADKICNQAITPEKINYMSLSKNMFNKNTVTVNSYVDITNGDLTYTTTQKTSDWIPVLPNTAITRTVSRRTTFYKSDKTFISGVDSGNDNTFTFTTPADCYYVRVSFLNGTEDTEQIELGNVRTAYKPYLYFISPSIVDVSGFSKWYNKKANFLGDSLTHGDGASAYQAYPFVVGNVLGLNTVRNYGISGSSIGTVQDCMAVRYADMENDADLIVLFGGRNDYRASTYVFGTMADRTTDTFYGACHVLMSGLVEKYPTKALGIILTYKAQCSTTPIQNDNVWANPYTNKYQEDYNNAIKEVARYYNIPALDLYNEGGISAWNAGQKSEFFYDTVHLNAAGYAYLGQKIAAWVNTI